MIKNETNIPNIPFEERNKNSTSPIWRYTKNPVIGRNPTALLGRVFNSAIVPYKNEFIGVFRAEDRTGIPHLYLGHSKDGLSIAFEDKPIEFTDENGKVVKSTYQYDPRLVKIENAYYVIWCDDFFGPALAIARTTDFKTFVKFGHPFLPFNRNGVLFPRKVNGEYLMLSRPSDSGHTSFGDIFLSRSPDLLHWGEHERVMERGYEWWNTVKIGAGANPIETDEGWLLLYHGVTSTCNGFVYSFSAVILDIDNPAKVLYRSQNYLLAPEESYETTGFVPNVVFPTSCLVDAASGKMAIYYGAADTVTALAFSKVDILMKYIKETSR